VVVAPRTAPRTLIELRPRSLIVTVFGAFLRDLGGWISVADLVSLMGDMTVDDRSVRSTLARLKRGGLIVSERHSPTAGYRLSEEGYRILAAADARIFRASLPAEITEWTLVVFSIPERERAHRHVLRSRLSWLGFGNVASGVWVAPAHVEEEACVMLTRHGLAEYVQIFRAEHRGPEEIRRAVTSWWNLDELAALYVEFIARYQPMLDAWKRGVDDPAAAFADYVRALTHWRRLPFLDPGLPPSVLPADWAGHRAASLFAGLRELLAGPALQHVERVTGLARRLDGQSAA
jgi:phenylacetic acid degradation operon negative regulatory protein